MSTIALVVIGLLIVAVLILYVSKREQMRIASELDERRRIELQELKDKNMAQLTALRGIARLVQDKPTDDPIRSLTKLHVWEPGLSYWQEKSE
ncbi:TPA: hypothetical protein ACNEJR_004689 [Escherichia coli]